MIGEKLTFHMPALAPRSTASPECTTNRTGNGVDASALTFASIASISRVCSTWITSPSPGTPGWSPLRESPYAKNENFVIPADAASAASGVAGGSIGLTEAAVAGGACGTDVVFL